jgi:hypothetical protein
MQNCVQDLFDTIFSRYTCYNTVSTYDTTLISLIINYGDTSAFCMHGMYDTSYDTTIVTSLRARKVGRRTKQDLTDQSISCRKKPTFTASDLR